MILVVVILVVSWLIVSVWSPVFELLKKRVLGIDEHDVGLALVYAVLFTFVMLAILYFCDADDLM